jgi:hypothetical protein
MDLVTLFYMGLGIGTLREGSGTMLPQKGNVDLLVSSNIPGKQNPNF